MRFFGKSTFGYATPVAKQSRYLTSTPSHKLLTITYNGGEFPGRAFKDREKAEQFAAKQKKSPVVKKIQKLNRSSKTDTNGSERERKLPTATDLAADFSGLIEREGFQPLAISAEHGIRAGLLSGPHKDPFDVPAGA